MPAEPEFSAQTFIDESETPSGLPSGASSYVESHHARVPDFAEHPTVEAIGSGNWSDDKIWSTGRAPQAGDVVLIGPGMVVAYDIVSDQAIQAVGVQGHLQFATDQDTRLKVGTLLVYPAGFLEIGSTEAPIAANAQTEIVIADQPLDLQFDPEQWGTGLVAFGKVRIHGRAQSETFMRLAREPRAGDVTLTLSEPVQGWEAGDEVFLPDTRQLRDFERGSRYVPQTEKLRLSSVSDDGLTLTLGSPLSFDHPGARDLAGNLDFLPHVANMTRNVRIESENPLGTRGHVTFLGRADVDVRYANFENLGRTTVDAVDNTTFDADGNVTHIGANQQGRYSLHFHHVAGPETPPATGHQFTVIGNSLSWDDPNRAKWGVVIHASHYGNLQQNVLQGAADAGIVTEDGSESFNVFEKNFVGDVWTDKGRGASGAFWFRGFNNTVRGNVAANVYTSNVESAYGFTYYAVYLGSVRVPTFPGADVMREGEYTLLHGNKIPIREFRNNEVYGSESGLTIWWLNQWGGGVTYELDGEGSLVQDLRVWHIYHHAYYGYETNKLTFDGYTVRQNASVLNNVYEFNYGMFFSDYYQVDLTVRHADIQGAKTGIALPPFNRGVRVEDSYLRNLYNVTKETMWSVNGGGYLTPAKAVLRNVRFDALPGRELSTIRLSYSAGGGRNVIQRDEILVEDYNGRPGENFRVLYTQQHPDFLVPQTGSNTSGRPVIGSPEAGLSNAQNWEKYGIAIAGEVAPCSDSACSNAWSYPEIAGYVFPISGAPNQPPAVDDQTFTVSENSDNGTIVGTVAASDPDVGQRLSFTLESGNEDGVFVIDPGTGVIRVADRRQLDYETASQFALTVRVSDDAAPAETDTAAITVNVDDVNEAPVAPDQTFTVREDAANGTIVGALSASDPDTGQSLNFAITAGNDGGAFAIDAQTGVITVANASLLAMQAEFTLTATASDNGSPPLSDEAAVSVTVNHANEPPIVDDQSFFIAENSLNGALVGVVAGHDPDAGQSLTYSIMGGNDDGAFAIDSQTGKITVNDGRQLDFESRTRYVLTVRASDDAASPLHDSAAVTIDVTDQNEAPVVVGQSFTVPANAQTGTLVGAVLATDPDTGQLLSFAITGGNGLGAFAINSRTGEITVADKRRLKKFESHTLTVSVTDNASPALSGSAAVVIDVTAPEGNRPPIVDNQVLAISENSPTGAIVGTISASDPDLEQSLTFSIASFKRRNPFAIDARTGVITVADARRLDYERTHQIAMKVRVRDNGSPSLSDTAMITIRLTDVVDRLAMALTTGVDQNGFDPTSAAEESTPASEYVWQNSHQRWDVNGDEQINAGDLLEILVHLREERGVRRPSSLSAESIDSRVYPDVNGDELVSMGDLLEILAKIRSLHSLQ